jgi:WD40 repeat protein
MNRKIIGLVFILALYGLAGNFSHNVPEAQAVTAPEIVGCAGGSDFGGPGGYRFDAIIKDPLNRTPTYVRFMIAKMDTKKLNHRTYTMVRGTQMSQGVQYSATVHFSTKDIGYYAYYCEAKIDGNLYHYPHYGGDPCTAGLCSTCCGEMSGPKIVNVALLKNQRIYLFQKGKSQPLWSINTGTRWTTGLAFSQDGQYVAAADDNAKVDLFNRSSDTPIWTFQGDTRPDNGNTGYDRGLVAFSRQYLVASLKGIVYLFTLDSNQPVWQYDIGYTMNGLSISADGKHIVAGGHNGTVYLWDSASSSPQWTYSIYAKGGMMDTSTIKSLAMTYNGKRFALGTSCPDRRVYVFTPTSSKPIYTVKAGKNYPVESVSISDDGRNVIVAGGGEIDDDPYSASLYRVGRTTPVWRFTYEKAPTLAAAVSPNGKRTAIGFFMPGIYFNNMASSSPTAQLQYAGYVSTLAFSRNNSYLAAGSGKNYVYLTNAAGTKVFNAWRTVNKIETIAISPDGLYVAAGTSLDRFRYIDESGTSNNSGAGVGKISSTRPRLKQL